MTAFYFMLLFGVIALAIGAFAFFDTDFYIDSEKRNFSTSFGSWLPFAEAKRRMYESGSYEIMTRLKGGLFMVIGLVMAVIAVVKLWG